MGKGAAKKSEALQSQAADRYSQMAQELTNEGRPQRQAVGRYYQNIISGGPEAYRVAAPEINFAKRQFANAKSQVRDYMPAGGQKNRAYRDLAITQPGAIAGIFQKKIEDSLARLSNLATGNTQGALNATGGISNAGAQLGQLAAARGQAVAGALGGIGSAVGTYFGMR